MSKLRIGSRGSKLALWQADHIARRLHSLGHDCEIKIIRTTGDEITTVALSKVGTKGMFTKELEEALAAAEIDLAVHSMKDMPTELPPGFSIAATTERDDPRDAFLSVRYDSLASLPSSAHVGTSSLRRQSQLLSRRPDLRMSPLRGNVDTRIRKLESGEFDAILLAAAGVKRLALEALVRERISPTSMVPAVGQGALAIEIADNRPGLHDIVRQLNDNISELCIIAERAFLRALGGGCQVPIAAYATIAHDKIHLDGLVARPDGAQIVRDRLTGDDAETVGTALAQRLIDSGAASILDDVYRSNAPVPTQP